MSRRVERLPEVPAEVLAAVPELRPVHYGDAYAVALDVLTYPTIDEVIAAFRRRPPAPVRVLMAVRDVLVRPFRLRTVDSFAARRVGEHQYHLGGGDRHLDFRACLLIDDGTAGRRLVLSTVVHFHNGFGRAYFFVVRPFHRLIVRDLLRSRFADPSTAGSRSRAENGLVTRIIAGSAGGRRIEAPRGQGTRPTSDRVREALFAGLAARDLLVGAAVLDLFAGSGALGLEAASRGAADVVLVESAREAVAVARRNASALGLPGVRVVLSSVQRYLAGRPPFPAGADLVLADPPYGFGEGELAAVLAGLCGGWLAERAVVVVERSSRSPEPRWPPALARTQVRRHGETTLWFATPTTPRDHAIQKPPPPS